MAFPPDPMRQGCVLGTPLQITTYQGLIRLCRNWANGSEVIALDFVNTHVVTLRRHAPWFRQLSESFDYFIPDGMPLIWCLNRQGAALKDRVYGPTFMRECIQETAGSLKHYFLGGSERCLERLVERFRRQDSSILIVGTYHGRCSIEGVLEGDDDDRVVAEINRLSPDLIWIGMGTPKQHAWINRNKTRLRRGILLGVGFAFDVNAGTKPDAPGWMQRLGLTWIFRLLSEPRRLLHRYLKYNTLFLFYLIWDGFRGKAFMEAEKTQSGRERSGGGRPGQG